MKHEEVWYSCDSCGSRMPGDYTEVTATSTDIACAEPTSEWQVCALCWLDLFNILNKQQNQKVQVARTEWVNQVSHPGISRLDVDDDDYRPWDR